MKTTHCKLIFLGMALLTGLFFASNIQGATINFVYNDDTESFLVLSESSIIRTDLEGVVNTTINLMDNEYAFASPDGSFLLVADYHQDVFPFVADLTLIGTDGSEIWNKVDIEFASARLSNNGNLLTVSFSGEGPQPSAMISLINPEGDIISSWNIPHLSEADFSDDGSRLAIDIPGDKIMVVSTDTGEITSQLNSANVFTLNSDGTIIVSAGINEVSIYREDENKTETHNTPIDIPRNVLIRQDNLILIAGKDGLFLIDLEEDTRTYSQLPDGNYSISSVDANEDLSRIVVGAYSSDHSAVLLYNGELELLDEYYFSLERRSSNEPQVLITPSGQIWMRTSSEISQVNFK